MSELSKEIYEFSQFRLEASERRLLRSRRVVRVPDKVFDTLLVLVRRHGELVTKEELMNAVWPDSIVEENNLDQKISALRGVLGDRGKSKEKSIETVRGHGYRFLPPVKVIRDLPQATAETGAAGKTATPIKGNREVRADLSVSPQSGNVIAVARWRKTEPEPVSQIAEISASRSESKDSAAETETRASKRRRMLLQIFVVGSLLIGLSILGWIVLSSSSGRFGGDANIESIAVLPFANDTGNPENDFLSDGLTESLIGSISQIPGLSVKARNSVFRYRNQEIDARKVGSELSVEGILIGRLTQRGENLMLSLELVDARTGNAIWSEQYNRNASEIVALQREISHDIAVRLRSRLSKADQDRVTKVYTSDPEANHFYLQGMYLLNKRTAEDIRKSIELFEQAASEDPAYAKAYTGIAMASLILPDYSHSLSRDELRAYDQKFRTAVQTAYALDNTLPESVLLSAAVKDVDWDVAGADREYQRAIELDPNFATPRHWYSRFLGGLGRFDEAIIQINKAYELDPYSRSIAFNIGARLADARRFDEAIEQYRRVLEIEPEHPLTHLALAMAYDAKGMYSQAIDEYERADVLLEKGSRADAAAKARALSSALGNGGEQGYWEKRLEYSLRDRKQGVGSDYAIAICLARLGRFEEVFRHLEASLVEREPNLFWIKTESAFDPIGNTPRFKELLARIGLPV